MATRAEIEAALAHYEKVGNLDAARKLKATLGAMAPDAEGKPFAQPAAPEPAQPGLVDRAAGEVAGAAETVGTLATGAVAAPLAGLGGGLYETARQILAGEFNPNDTSSVDEFADRAATEATYVPRTQAGQRNVAAIGAAIEPVAADLPALNAAGGELNAIGQAARNATQATRAAAEATGAPAAVARAAARTGEAARTAGAKVADVASDAAAAVRDRLPGRAPPVGESGGFGPRSAGSAEVPVEDLRVAKAGELPVPIKYTKAQRTRTFEDQRLERETLAKNPEIGEPIREHYREQHEQLAANVDSLIHSSGATKTDSLRGIGEAVVTPIVGKLEARKAKVRVKYAEAEKAGELEGPVELAGLVDYLNNNKTLSASVLNDVRGKIVEAGGATRGEDGKLVPKTITLKQGEELRQFIGEATGSDRKEIRQATRLKKAYDADTEGAGGQLYKAARAEHARLQRDFENASAVSRLLKNKRNTGDRQVAFEDVLNRTVIDDSTSLDQLKTVTRVLKQSGPEGRQGLKELRGGTLQWVIDQATESVASNQAVTGGRTLSPTKLHKAISKLDKSGKLEHLFGKKEAETLRILDEVAQDVLTAPPGTVNHSGTASAIAALLDISLAAGTGIPVPVATGLKLLSKQVRNAKLRAKVQEHLK